MVCRSLVLLHCIDIKSKKKSKFFKNKNRTKKSNFFQKIDFFCFLLLHRTYFGPRFVFIWTEGLHEVLEYDFTLECQQLLFAALFPKKLPVRPFTVPHTLLLQQPAGRSAVHFAIQNTSA